MTAGDPISGSGKVADGLIMVVLTSADIAIWAPFTGLVRPGTPVDVLSAPWVVLAAHLLLAALILVAALARYRSGTRRPLFFLWALSVIVMGPLGALGAALCGACHRFFARTATPFEAWYRTLFPVETRERTRTLYDTLAYHGAMPAAQSTVAPFVDVLAVGTVRQKHLTLVLISDHFRADFAPALRRALNDNEPAIRVQAATAVARIETRFLERGMALEAAHAGAPDDVDHMAALAAHHADFAATGLLDDERAEATCRQALSLYERCRAHKPDEVSFALAIGRLLLRMKRPAEALDVLEPHAACEDAATDLLLLQAGALFMAGRLVDLRALCARIDARDPQPLADDDPDREALRLWSRGGVA